MNTSTKYKERDDALGRAMLTLRTRLGLTQASLAESLGVSPRAVIGWEAGSSYPKVDHFKHFIELAVQRHAFSSGHEREEIQDLWRLAHQKVLLDEIWLKNVLKTSALPSNFSEDPNDGFSAPSSAPGANQYPSERNQLLATKFYIPLSSHTLVSRPRLTDGLLSLSVEYPLTLVSAPAGFGKTMLLSSWLRSLPEGKYLVAWLSLDEDDNDPVRFCRYLLTALEQRLPGVLADLIAFLEAQQAPFLQSLMMTLINRLADIQESIFLVLDDYHLISETAISSLLVFLLDHMPSGVHLILATRADPLFPISRLRVQGKLLEIRTEQLQCTTEETRLFLERVMNIYLPDEHIEQINERTEGWIVGLQLLGLSLQGREMPENLLDVLSGSLRYILDFLTDEVLQRQDHSMQAFLLNTSILERFSAPLCDAVMEQKNSQRMLERLERANLFVVLLDMQRQWYRYHPLFAEALRYRLAQVGEETVATLHYRASRWYAEQGQSNEAVTHALQAKNWEWAADLIEAAAREQMVIWKGEIYLRRWIDQLPTEVIRGRPLLSFTYALSLVSDAPPEPVEDWLQAAEEGIRSRLSQLNSEHREAEAALQNELYGMLGTTLVIRAFNASLRGNSALAVTLNQQALKYLSEKNLSARALVAASRGLLHISIGEAVLATQDFLEAASFSQSAGLPAITFIITASTYLLYQGRLREAWDLHAQAITLGQAEGVVISPLASRAYGFQADLLREWNRLDETDDLLNRAVQMAEQTRELISLETIYAIRVQVASTKGNNKLAASSLEQAEQIAAQLKSPLTYLFQTLPRQIRFLILQGKIERAEQIVEELLQQEQWTAPLFIERIKVARVRVLLAQRKPEEMLQLLPNLLQEAIRQERFAHAIEMYLFQALAYRMEEQEQEALASLREALRLAEPEGYIRIFVDEGPQMAALLAIIRGQERQHGATPYLDLLLNAFPAAREQASSTSPVIQQQGLLDPLTERELEVLREVAQGATNQQIAEKLAITVKTVKSHVTHIYEKLAAKNRMQAVARAYSLGLLSDE